MSNPLEQSNHDPWSLLPGGGTVLWPEPDRLALQIEIIEGVEALDAQIGVFPKKTVPDALHDALFSEPEPTDAEIEAAGGDPAAVPPMQTYAILDAAKLINLPELLERSGLEHRCLFKGAAYDELKNVAPWIVRLEEGNLFTRNLFTRSDAAWHLWDKEPGIIIRSRATTTALGGHFRRFARVRDEAGKWFFFRFWEPAYACEYFKAIATDLVRVRRWFGDQSMFVSAIITPSSQSVVFSPAPGTSDVADTARLVLRYGQTERRAHIAARRHLFVVKLSGHLTRQNAAFAALKPDTRYAKTGEIIELARQYQILIERAVADFATASVLLQHPFETDPELTKILTSDMHQLDKGRLLLARAKQLLISK